jgi:hypothetical protein
MRVVGVLCAATFIALLAGPAYAQSQSVPRYGEPEKDKTPQQKAAEKEAEQAYKRSLGNVPDKAPADPWGNVRSDSAPKPVAKDTAAKKTKTGSTAK